MKSLAFVILSLAAGCATDGDDARYVVPQGVDPSVIGGTGSNASTVTGRVCVASDLRTPGVCSIGDAGGFAVTLAGVTTLTAADGSFTLPAAASGTSFTVMGTSTTGVTLLPTTSPLVASTGSVLVPAIDAELFQSILVANGVTLPDGTGTILANVSRNGTSAAGVSVISAPTSSAGPFYPGVSGTAFGTTGGTSTLGTVMIPGLAAGTVDLSYQTVLGGLETTVNGVTVRNGGVTVLDTQLPSSGTP